MKPKTLAILGLLSIFGFLSAEADTYEQASKEAVALADDSGISKAALVFDLTSLRSGGNRHIEEAILDWWVSGIAPESSPVFSAYPILASWTKSTVQNGASLAVGEASVAQYQVNNLIPDKGNGRLVRLDVTSLVREWADGSKSNYGIVIIATAGVSANDLDSQLGKAHLTIRYGFRDN